MAKKHVYVQCRSDYECTTQIFSYVLFKQTN